MIHKSVILRKAIATKINILTCGRRYLNKSHSNMEGLANLLSGPFGSPDVKAAKTNFVGISPLRELTNVQTPTDRPFRVSIEGNIGAGKSTLINYFQAFEHIQTYPEPIEWWRNLNGYNLLDLMYTDVQEWLKVFQSYVQFTRLVTQTSKPKDSSIRVQMFERSIQNNRFCFMEQAYSNGLLHSADYTVLDDWYRWVRSNVDIHLDLIVYLRSTPKVVYERVQSRARPEEKFISLEYLTQLHESHETWLMSDNERFNTIPVLVLDADATLDKIEEQYKMNESTILGHDKKGKRPTITKEGKDKIRKALDL